MSYSSAEIDCFIWELAKRIENANGGRICDEIRIVCRAMIQIQQSQTVKKRSTGLFHDMVMFAEIGDILCA